LGLSRRLAPLREEGILILRSGNVVHNLGRIDWNQPDGSFDWARRFDEKVAEIMTSGPGEILLVVEDDDYSLAGPTPIISSTCSTSPAWPTLLNRRPNVPVASNAMGSPSMTCFTLGLR
jgi:4,5-DOPA dioxygenase extradiol